MAPDEIEIHPDSSRHKDTVEHADRARPAEQEAHDGGLATPDLQKRVDDVAAHEGEAALTGAESIHATHSTHHTQTWDDEEMPPLGLNYDALLHIASCYLPGGHGECTDIVTQMPGAFNEIRILKFADGWSCIARFNRVQGQDVRVPESAYATMEYVRNHTTIPVPEVYFTNLDPSNAVGAPFVLMERMPGTTLYEIWDDLSMHYKLAVVEQIASVLVQLASLRFDNIGSLNANGEMGPLVSIAVPSKELRGPFTTTADWLCSFVTESTTQSPQLRSHYETIRAVIEEDLSDQGGDAIYNPPFRLYHHDLDGQNVMFKWPDKSLPPKLSGVIDWDYSFTGPLYYLYEYPIFIQDVEWSEELYDDNKTLRKHFVKTLIQSFPPGSDDRKDVRECFRQKTYIYNAFLHLWVKRSCDNEQNENFRRDRERAVESYRKGIDGTKEEDLDREYHAYGGRLEWEADSEPESEDEER